MTNYIIIIIINKAVLDRKMSSCSSFWGELVKNFNKTPALRPGMKGLRPGARLSIYNVAPLVKKFNKTQLILPKTQLIPPHNLVSQLNLTPNAAKFLLSQVIDMGKVAAPLIVKNFNKIARATPYIAAPFPGPSRSSFRSSFGPSSRPTTLPDGVAAAEGSRRSSDRIC